MAYGIAKPSMYRNFYYVTAIRRGGLSIDNIRYDPDDRFDARCLARRWKNEASAIKALESMRTVGGFDDYQIVPLL